MFNIIIKIHDFLRGFFISNIIKIRDLSRKNLDMYTKLSSKECLSLKKPKRGVFIVTSKKLIEQALDAGFQPISMLIEDQYLNDSNRILINRCGKIPIYAAPFTVLNQLKNYENTDGMLCAMHAPKCPTLTQICKETQRIVILERVTNPLNVGHIFRSASAFGIDAVVLTSGSSNPLYPRAISESMGKVFQIPWTFIDGYSFLADKGIPQLHELGFKTVALALTDDSVQLDDQQLAQEPKLAIILGNEGFGVSEATLSNCDYIVKIPMAHGVDSLNVSTAGAIAFYQFSKI